MSDNKSNNAVISSMYNNNNNNNKNDISQNITNVNNTENKENINKDNKDNKDNINKKEEEESSSDEEIIEHKYNSFYINGPKLFIEDDDNDIKNKYNIYYKTISYFDSFKKKLDKIMSLKKKKKKEENNEKNENSEEKEYEEEESEEGVKRERIRRIKKNISVKGVKGLFLDDNNNIEINKDKETEEETEEKDEEIPQKSWEAKLELFKQYIKNLKGMTDKQFKNDSMKYLNEIEKEDFSGKAKLSQVERINKYKAFLIKVEKKRNDFNNYYSSHIIFTPGCIFNTGEIFK